MSRTALRFDPLPLRPRHLRPDELAAVFGGDCGTPWKPCKSEKDCCQYAGHLVCRPDTPPGCEKGCCQTP
jgi:hypothetical protein